MSKPLTEKEMSAVEEFVKDLQKLFSNSIELEHFINIIHEIYLLRKNAKYEADHISALWDDNENLRGACEAAMGVIVGCNQRSWNAERDAVMEKLEDALLVKEADPQVVCDHCGQRREIV